MLPVTQAQPVSKIIRNALSGELAFNPTPAGKLVGIDGKDFALAVRVPATHRAQKRL